MSEWLCYFGNELLSIKTYNYRPVFDWTNLKTKRPPSVSSPPLRTHAYSNILKNLSPKNENFQIKKKSDIFHISPRGGSNEYQQSMFLSGNKKK